MNIFDQYIGRERIIAYLSKIRASQAQQRHNNHLIHLLTANETFNYHVNTEKQTGKIGKEEKLLIDLLPSRRQWIKLNREERYRKIFQDNNIGRRTSYQRLNSVDYNIKSLKLTIEYYEKNAPKEPFLIRLNQFIADIHDAVNDPLFCIETPSIIPGLKDTKKSDNNECRPYAMFTLKNRIIIGLVNKYFTEQFEPYFKPCAFAFRAPQKTLDWKRKKPVTHHDAVQEILNYRKKFQCDSLWVSECDISKFFDAVDHSIVIEQFKKLILELKTNTPDLYDLRAERLFYNYLQSYSFVHDVLLKYPRENYEYWREHNIPGGYFSWVENELRDSGYYNSINESRIGIPQGGALSGLIANIILNIADDEVLKLNDSDLLYVRYCDDIVIIHPFKEKCEKASKVYYDSLINLHLIPHQYTPVTRDKLDLFWSKKIKSKFPYKWSLDNNDGFPWFGFLGYEICYSGDLRVRKKSIIKQKRKQKEVVLKIWNAVREGRRKKIDSICKSAAGRMIGMSVGRVNLSNYKQVQNEMCWANGFVKLNDNTHLRAQLRDLDRYKSLQLSWLFKLLKKTVVEDLIKPNTIIRKSTFSKIPGISDRDSNEIRNSLLSHKILNSGFRVDRRTNVNGFDFQLPLHYEPYKNEIIDILFNPTIKSHKEFYGNPYSYYYQIIERRNLQ